MVQDCMKTAVSKLMHCVGRCCCKKFVFCNCSCQCPAQMHRSTPDQDSSWLCQQKEAEQGLRKRCGADRAGDEMPVRHIPPHQNSMHRLIWQKGMSFLRRRCDQCPTACSFDCVVKSIWAEMSEVPQRQAGGARSLIPGPALQSLRLCQVWSGIDSGSAGSRARLAALPSSLETCRCSLCIFPP